MSYVGELGYELHIKSSGKGITSIFETLYSAKNVSLAGFEALNSMSLEKGHRQEQTNYRTGIYSTPINQLLSQARKKLFHIFQHLQFLSYKNVIYLKRKLRTIIIDI